MRWKMYTVLAALVLMVTIAPLIKVQAQSIILIAIYAVVGVGPGETAGFHWVSKPSQATSQRPVIQPGDTVTFTIVVTNSGPSQLNGACTQTFSSPVMANKGLNTLQASINGGELLVNGQVVGLLDDPCFALGGKRNTIAIGPTFPPGFSQQMDSNPNAIALTLPRVLITSYDISNTSDGTTRAIGRAIIREPAVFLFDEPLNNE